MAVPWAPGVRNTRCLKNCVIIKNIACVQLVYSNFPIPLRPQCNAVKLVKKHSTSELCGLLSDRVKVTANSGNIKVLQNAGH